MTSKPSFSKFNRVAALYRKCRAFMLMELSITKTPLEASEHLVLSKETMRSFARCVVNGNTGSMFRDMDIPKYMFEAKPVTPSTWVELQKMELDTYMLVNRTAMLVDPVTREYCYVFWDEAGQCSNPYPTQREALKAVSAYQP